MQQIFERPYIELDERVYLKLIMVLAPLINFLSGIVIDMYAPSMPNIAMDFHVSAGLVENTITATAFGCAIGGVCLGVIFDNFGRRKVIISALLIFVFISLLAPFCSNIYQLIIIRVIQGVTAATMSVGCRVVMADHFTGRQLTIGILYASFGFAIGTVVAPFIGGYVQYHLGWHANFYIFALFGSILVILFTLFVHERFQKQYSYHLKHVIKIYQKILLHKKFMSGIIIVSIAQINLIFYPTVAPFLVEHQLHYSSIVYGNTALIVSLGYLIGSISNRVMLRNLNQTYLMDTGLYIFAGATLMQLVLGLIFKLNLLGLVLPVFLICYANGFLVGNATSACMQLFPANTGIVTSTIIGLMMLLAACGNYLISCVKISSFTDIALIFGLLLFIQFMIYKYFFRNN